MNSEKFLKHPVRHYIWKYRGPFALGLFFLLITNALDAVYPLIMKKAIDQIAAGEALSAIAMTSLLFFAVMAGLALTRYCWRVFFGRYHTAAAEDLRNRFFNHLTDLGPHFFHRHQIGELMSLITNDVQAFRAGIGSGLLILFDGVSIIFLVIPLMLYLEPTWTWKTLIFLPAVPFLIWLVTKLTFKAFKKQQDDLSDLAAFTQEIVSGIRVIKGFHQEDNKVKSYNHISDRYEKSSNHVALIDAFFPPIMRFGVASGTVILLFIAGPDIIGGVATIGTLVAFQRYISKMVWPMTALGYGLSQYQKGLASFDRIKKILEEQTDIPNTGTHRGQEFQSLKVENLTFSYPETEAPTLKNLSFEIHKGDFVGVIGTVGAGKTTLLQILSRLYPVSHGRVLYNGIPIEQWDTTSLRQLVATVPQEPFLFSESIAENVLLGRQDETDPSVVEQYTEIVDLKEELESLPQKYNSQLGERGVNLSGGQKQRLALARGLALSAPVLLLDDVLSAVDTKTEKKIEVALNQRTTQQTKLIVTHRLSVVAKANMLIVINNGEIEAIGSHQELAKISPTYQKMAEIQEFSV
ncbi:MAG: ABC transporter ATP-binding protein [Pseudobdellovibrionaceae bacterium]